MNNWTNQGGQAQPMPQEMPQEMPSMESSNQDSHEHMHRHKEKADCAHPSLSMLAMEDPENPLNFPVLKKLYISSVAWMFTFSLLFGATGITAGLKPIAKEFNVSMTKAILTFSVYLFGIAAAPLYTPHVSQFCGRTPVYIVSAIGLAVFSIGAGASNSIAALLATRFFAGLFGGPIVVNIEGTFADLWSASHTGTYYSGLTAAQYIGAALGPLVGGYVVTDKSWRWTQWVTAIAVFVSLLLSVGVPETFGRQIIRNRARRLGVPNELPEAPSGQTFPVMARLTIVDPIIMFFTNPLVTVLAFYMMLNFGVLFQFFISVPVALTGYKFDLERIGLAFITPAAAALAAVVLVAIIEHWTFMVGFSRSHHGYIPRTLPGSDSLAAIEFRMFPAMIGSVFAVASLFWLGNTVGVTTVAAPVVATGFFVWGSALQLIATISYLFDSFPQQGTLSALTVVAVARVALAGVIPIVIVPMLTHLTPKWAFSTFGFIEIAFLPVPFVIYFFGGKLRAASRFSKTGAKNAALTQKEESDDGNESV